MIDKVQKIREEVERLKGWNNNVRNSTRHMTLQEEDFNRGKHSSYIEILDFIDSLQEEAASEELEDAAIEICSKVLKGETITIDGYEYVVLSDAEECFKAGAKWQKEKEYTCYEEAFEDGAKWKAEQFEKNRLAACDRQTEEEAEIERDFVTSIIEKEHRQPTFDDAIKYGMRLKEQQMMKDAIDADVVVDRIGEVTYLCPHTKATCNKVKVIVIKED